MNCIGNQSGRGAHVGQAATPGEAVRATGMIPREGRIFHNCGFFLYRLPARNPSVPRSRLGCLGGNQKRTGCSRPPVPRLKMGGGNQPVGRPAGERYATGRGNFIQIICTHSWKVFPRAGEWTSGKGTRPRAVHGGTEPDR